MFFIPNPIEIKTEPEVPVGRTFIRVIGQDYSEHMFHVQNDTPMEELKIAYGRWVKKQVDKMRFRFEGQAISATDTVTSLGMVRGDAIEVYGEQPDRDVLKAMKLYW